MPCISTSFDPNIGPIINIGIAKPNTLRTANQQSSPVITLFSALIDTGASITCISPKIAQTVGLRPTGKMQMASASQVVAVNSYLADVALPFGDPVAAVQTQTLASESMTLMEYQSNNTGYEALIGRDLICKGLFSMTGWDKRFTICI